MHYTLTLNQIQSIIFHWGKYIVFEKKIRSRSKFKSKIRLYKNNIFVFIIGNFIIYLLYEVYNMKYLIFI